MNDDSNKMYELAEKIGNISKQMREAAVLCEALGCQEMEDVLNSHCIEYTMTYFILKQM